MRFFFALDKNSDGVLTISEVAHGLQNMNVKYSSEIQSLLNELDTDGNGTIDYTEFVAASIDHKLFEQESACSAAFRVFDLNGDGQITVDELHQVTQMNFIQAAFTREMLEEMVREVDLDNDGTINYDEFIRMMRGTQKKKYENASTFSKARALLYRRFE